MKRFRNTVFCITLMIALSTVCSAQTTEIKFTEKEKQFINQNPVVHLCVDPGFVPYEFIDSDGEYKGIAADYIKILSERTGIQMVVEENLPWSKAYELAVEKKLDVLPCVGKTEQREQYFLFSEPYIDFQRVVVVNKENNTIKNLNDLKQIKVAVQTNSSHHSYLKSFPEIELSLYTSVDDALSAVSNGSEVAFVGNLATSSYFIKEKGFTNLKYIILDAENVQSLHFAVRNDWPELVSIINKGLASITEEEKIEINNKWIGVENQMDYGPILRIIAVIVFFLIVSVFWTIKLKKEVAKRKKIEEELRRAKSEAEVANQIKSSFLARMSHEIRTPLNAITGMSYLIQKTDINVTQKMYLEKITQASYNMLGIINDILDFSKIESGKIELERISFNLDKLIQQVINIISFKIEEQGIGFSMSKDPKMPINFFGDPKRIEQILINIINNAVKFTTAGEVSLAVNLVARKGNFYDLEFCIKDTGIGMSEEQLDQLFTPFAQGDSSINRRFGGTGLGLSIVKSLTEIMGGEVVVKSVLGEGSKFTVRLSLEIDQSKELEDKQKVAAFYFQDVKTLVLDKNATNLNLIENYLESFGISAKLATSESEALELLEISEELNVKPFNLLIMDYDTPAEGGIDFVEKIRSNRQVPSELKVIMMIPLMREDLFQKIEEFEINLGITKPIIPSILYNGILEIFKTKTLELEEAIPIAKVSEGSKNENSYHVLVVEDNKTNQFIAKVILEEAGYEVALAENGEEGVEYFQEHQEEINLILMDLHMPILNGYEASIRIRKLNEAIPIVAMTADAITGIEGECNRAGINYYISKPFEPEKFLDTISNILKSYTEEKNKAQKEKLTEVQSYSSDILDEADGLKRIGNNIPVYHMILKEYLNENKDVVETLKRAIDSHSYQEAIQIVHKNKGGSGNIGAKKLYDIASELQKALSGDGNDETERLLQEFNVTLNKLIFEIEQKLNL